MTSTTGRGTVPVDGWVAAGYERVRDTFDAGSTDLVPGGGAFAAYVDGRKVVDLWGGTARDDTPWTQDTLAVAMSATKGMVTLCAQILVDRGLLDIEAPVATYWPEFADGGKEATTVRHVLTHTAGVLGFAQHDRLLQADGTGWDDYEAIAAGLAAAAPCWESGTRFGYHAMSYGWLVGELVRSVSGQSLGTFLAKNVAEPLGLDLHVGTPVSEHRRVAHVTGDLRVGLPFLARLTFPYLMRRVRNPATLSGQAYLAANGRCLLDDAAEFFRHERVLRAEIPSGNGTTTARSLARVYAALSMGGELEGVHIISPASVQQFAVPAVRGLDALMDDFGWAKRLLARPVTRSLGYVINPSAPTEPGKKGRQGRFGPNPTSFGHDGAGGQIGFCDLDNRIAVGYVRNMLTSSPRLSDQLIGAVYAAAGRG